MTELISEFVDSYISENTRGAYKKDVFHFLKFFKEFHKTDLNLTAISPQDLRLYRDHLHTDLGLSPGSVNRTFSSLSSFFRFLMEKGVIDKNPARMVRRPKMQVLKDTLGFTDNEVSLILSAFDEADLKSLQKKLIFHFLFLTGARVSELTGIKIKDLDLNHYPGSVTLYGKGGKYRKIPLHPDLKVLLMKFLERTEKPSFSPLFSRIQKTQISQNPLTRMSIHDLVKKTLLELGLDPNRSCHSSRRTLISQLLEKGEQIKEVQEIAGHVSPTTTLRYHVRSVPMEQSAILRLNKREAKASNE